VEYFAGFDVGTHLTSVCVIDAKGEIAFECELPTDPDTLAKALKPWRASLRQIGHEAGSMAPWLHGEMEQRGFRMVCLEAFHARQAMKAQRNKTDKHDARGIAHLVRSGWVRSVHIKSDASYRLRYLLGQRSLLVRKRVDIENTIRQSLKVFGLRITGVNRHGFEARARELVSDDKMLAGLVEAMLRVRSVLVEQIAGLHKLVLACARGDELVRRFMEIPGVGPITALLFKATIDEPSRFRSAKDVGAYFGLTPKRWQSGETIDRQGRISKMGDKDVCPPPINLSARRQFKWPVEGCCCACPSAYAEGQARCQSSGSPIGRCGGTWTTGDRVRRRRRPPRGRVSASGRRDGSRPPPSCRASGRLAGGGAHARIRWLTFGMRRSCRSSSSIRICAPRPSWRSCSGFIQPRMTSASCVRSKGGSRSGAACAGRSES